LALNPDISIIIITHNRAEQVAECVRSVARMDTQALRCEVVVVLDSCADDTWRVLEALRPALPFPMLLDSINAKRPSIARNRGAQQARGALLLFLDDDVTASPALVMEHWLSHQSADVVIGYLKPAFRRDPGFWQLGARLWWEDRFTAMREPGHKLGFGDLFTANLSIKSPLFHSLGGFDESLARLEDYEFGIRLIKAGTLLVHNPRAIATHWEVNSVVKWVGRARLEAESEFRMGQKHPEFRESIFRERLDKGESALTAWSSRIREIAFKRSVFVDVLIGLLTKSLPALEALKARRSWRHIMGGGHEYSYWRQITRHFRSEPEFFSWIGK